MHAIISQAFVPFMNFIVCDLVTAESALLEAEYKQKQTKKDFS